MHQQIRFLCESCHQEVFLQDDYCSKCGGIIEWPEEIEKVITSWNAKEKKRK